MASVYTSTPRSAHTYARPQHTRGPSAVTDTPTPSSHSSIPPQSSIRPMPSHSSLHDLSHAALKRRNSLSQPANGGGLRAGSPNTLNRPLSRLSKSSLFDSDLDHHLPDPIHRDNTELDRINKENSIQRLLGDLQHDRLTLSDSASSVASRSSDGQLEREGGGREFVDEDDSDARSGRSRSSASSRSSLSIRLGLAGTAAGGGQRRTVDPLDPLDAPTEEDDTEHSELTYVTLPRSSPAQSPAKLAALSPARRPVAASSPLRPSTQYADENAPPSSRPAPSSAPHSSAAPFSRSPFPPKAYPTVPPLARAPAPPAAFRSPLSSIAAAKNTTAARPSPLNPQINSPVLGGSPTATLSFSSGAPSRSRQASYRPPPTEAGDGEGDASYRLPNATVLTEALQTPAKVRYRGAAVGGAAKRKEGSEGSGSGSGKSAEANLVSTALTSLTAKLSSLERDNAASSARVAELEALLAARPSPASTAREQQELKREVEQLLAAERGRYEELEKVVRSLRAQNTHLDAVLGQQHLDLDALRRDRAAAAAAVPPPPAAAQPSGELVAEVRDLKTGLEVLGFEVDGVRTVVEELLRDKEDRERGRKWEVEEEERRRALHAAAEEDPERTPRPSTVQKGGVRTDEVPGTPGSVGGRSFISDADLDLLRAEQSLEASRRTPRSKPSRRHLAASPPPRPASAPLHHHHHPHHHQLEEEEASYRPSTATFDGESVSYSQESYTYIDGSEADLEAESAYATEDEPEVLPPLPSSRSKPAPKKKERASKEPEPDFERAERIFADVSRATAHSHAHSPRRRTGQPRRSRSADADARTTRRDRVVLVEEPSANLCRNCHGRKRGLKEGEAEAKKAAAAAAAAAAKKDEQRAVKEKAAKEKEQRQKEKEREEHRRTLEGVLQRLEDDFGVQKQIYLELTSEYQSMTSRSETAKRRALASHLKRSIDVLEEKAREVKQYADAIEDLYETLHAHVCPMSGRKLHAVV
ncbi:hypothetical protein JCM8097_006890 [Rhodosporidiobolus ruineniae]